KDPAGRFQTAAEVAGLLERWLAHLQQPGVVAPTVRPEPGSPKPQAPPPRGRRVVAVLLLAVALLGVCAVLYWVLGQRDETKKPDASNGAAQEAPPWRPLTLDELAKLPSPLDALKREAMELPGD